LRAATTRVLKRHLHFPDPTRCVTAWRLDSVPKTVVTDAAAVPARFD
jgi:hypothetical protein